MVAHLLKEHVMALKPTEYGGSDTDKTQGAQPAPHQLTADEELRLMHSIDPAATGEEVDE